MSNVKLGPASSLMSVRYKVSGARALQDEWGDKFKPEYLTVVFKNGQFLSATTYGSFSDKDVEWGTQIKYHSNGKSVFGRRMPKWVRDKVAYGLTGSNLYSEAAYGLRYRHDS